MKLCTHFVIHTMIKDTYCMTPTVEAPLQMHQQCVESQSREAKAACRFPLRMPAE